MTEPVFYRCNKCGNLVAVINDGGCVPQCCGQPMEKLVADSTDAAVEKHVPVVKKDEDGKHIIATVGAVEHPMTKEHYIMWIALATDDNIVVKHLHPGDKPQAKFSACCAKGGTVYAYCNLHGLWKSEAEI